MYYKIVNTVLRTCFVYFFLALHYIVEVGFLVEKVNFGMHTIYPAVELVRNTVSPTLFSQMIKCFTFSSTPMIHAFDRSSSL